MKLENRFLSIFAVFAFCVAATSAWAEELELSGEGVHREVRIPVEGQHTLTIPDGVTIIELSSSNNNQAMNSSLTLTAPTGKKLQVMEGGASGLFHENVGNLEGFSTDSLFVYDGSNSSALELFKAARGTFMEMLTSSGQSMTIHYKENDPKGSWYYSLRFSLTVVVADLNTPHNIAVDSDCDIEGKGTVALPGPTMANTPVALTVTPNEGYVLEYVSVGSEGSYGSIGYEIHGAEFVMFPGNEVTFNMPGTDVRVCPEFISTSNLQNGLVIGTPMDRILRAAIPSGVQSFKIEGGGSDNDLSKPMILTAPEGYLFDVSDADDLFAYDGIVEDGYYTGADLLQGVTSGRNLTLVYASKGEPYKRSINLVANEKHDVVLPENLYHGSITVNPESRKVYSGDPVTLTAQPESGYALQPIRIDGVPVMGGSWYTSNEASFVMPRENVYIYPSFAKISDNELRMNMPDTGTLVANVPEGIEAFTIMGTRNRSYSKEAVLVVNAPAGRKIQLGPLTGQMHEDFLLAYDGPDANSALLFNRSADGLGKISVDAYYGGYVSSTQSVAIVQPKSNEYEFELKVLVVNPNESHNITINNKNGGTVSSEISSATAKTQVALNVETTGSNVVNWIEVESGNTTIPVTGGTWYTSNNASFLMPGANVSVTPHYAAGLTAEDGLTIEKPRFEKLEVTIPDGVESFQINGSINISSSSMAPGKPLVLTAPRGKIMQLETIYGDPYVGYEAAFVAYDGAYDDPVAENATPIEGNVSSGRVLTLVDYLYNGQNSIIVRLVSAKEYSISPATTINPEALIENGSVIVSPGSISPESGVAFAGDTVTLTAVPDEGYLLNAMVILLTENGNIVMQEGTSMPAFVDFTGGTWYNNEVKFVMPASDVVYMPLFVLAENVKHEINMPKSDTIRINIENPENVPDYVVFDNGGEYGNYSDNVDGVLELTVPEGYCIGVSGSTWNMDEGDSLMIYDGDKNVIEKFEEQDWWYVSSGRNITLRIKSDGKGSGRGVELLIYTLKHSGSSAVHVYEYVDDGYKWAEIDGDYTGTDAVNIPEPIEVSWINFNREFMAGVPSTVVLPFTLPAGTNLNGAKFYYLKNVVQNGTTWRATMKWIGEGNLPQANTPYSVICQGESLEFNMNHQKAVLQTTELIPVAAAETDNWLFVGVYAYKTWQESDNDEEIRDGLAYAITGHNVNGVPKGTFAKVSSGVNANPMRAYMRKKDKNVQLQPVAQTIRASGASYGLNNIGPEIIEVEFVDDEKTTAIGRMNTITGEIKIDRWYDLKGRRVNNVKRAAKGAYYGKRL